MADLNPDLDPVDRFVENESVARFDINPPTQLLDWKPLHERIRTDGRDHPTSEDSGQQKNEGEAHVANRKEKMIEGMWRRLRTRLEEDGYQALREMESRLETYKAEESSRVHQLGTEHYAAREYQDLLQRLIDEFGPEKEIVRALNETSTLQPKYDLSWEAYPNGSSGGPVTIESVRDGRTPEYCTFEWNGTIQIPDGYIKEYGFSKDDNTSFNFEGSEELNSVYDSLSKIVRKLERQKQDVNSLLRLVSFRLQMVRRFLWTLEVAGRAVSEPTTGTKIPDSVRGHDTLVKYACCILKLKKIILGEDDRLPLESNLPTQKELRKIVEGKYDIKKITTSSKALVEGSVRLIRRHMFSNKYDRFRNDYYNLLFEHEDMIFKIADKMGVEVPEPNMKTGG